MLIRIRKEREANRLICTRDDGSHTQEAIGPNLPYHDIAHFVVERELGMRHGFFGAIADGRGIAELTQPDTIRTLPAQAWEAEVVTRALQGLSNGAVERDAFINVVQAELGSVPQGLDEAAVMRMLAAYASLLKEWEAVEEGAALALRWGS